MSNANIESISALTPLQEGILFHTLGTSIPGVYFDQFVCTLKGMSDADMLEQAWHGVVARHAVLRTFFTWEKRDKPLQIVRRHVELPWVQEDWSDRPVDEQSLQNYLAADRKRGFDLSNAPLMRIALIRISSTKTKMIWSFHHLILDGWSVRLLLAELSDLYAGMTSGTHKELPEAPPFARFVEWHQQQDTAKIASFWGDYLQGFTRPTCPDIQPGSIVAISEQDEIFGQVTEQRMDQAVYGELKQLAQQQRVTLNTVFVAAWSVLLSRYCDTNDVVFGTTVAGRPLDLDDVDRIAGLFINTIPMRMQLSANTSVAALLKQVQADQTRQREYHHSSLALVQRSSELASGTALFETILVFENFPSFKQNEKSGKAQPLEYSEQAFYEYSNFPLALLVVPDDSLSMIVVHNTQRFSAQTVTTLLGHLTQILSEFVRQPEAPVIALNMLSPAEQNLCATSISATVTDWPVQTTVVDLFQKCVAQSPDATAVTAGDHCLSYAQLNHRANQLAQRILTQSPACGAALIYCERGSDAIVAMFGALKAGLPYVVFDIKDPVERVSQIVDDLSRSVCSNDARQTPVIITQSHLAAKLPDKVSMIQLNTEIEAQSNESPNINIEPSQMAYIIYTSGSTGRPKGVMIAHESLANSTQARFRYFKDPVKNFALLSSLSTDSSIAGVFWTLCSGGNLLIPDSRAELDIEQLARAFHQHQITHTLCVPSLYTLILEHSDAALLDALRTVVVAGEACGSSLVKQHFQTLPMAQLYNEYGPSEACVWATVEQLIESDADSTVTIGRPIANTSVYVLDHNCHSVPTGVTGELYIGGANVALGYLGSAHETGQVFIPNPFAKHPHRTLYKTGDRARQLANQKIEFLGRVDHQVKVRGYRVEPGEIESTLMAHPDVASAVVIIDDTANLDTELTHLLAQTDSDTVERLLTELEQEADSEIISQQGGVK